MKKVLLVLLGICALVAASYVFAQEAAAPTAAPAVAESKTVTGEVVSVDTEKAVITIKYVTDAAQNATAEMALSVNEGTTLGKGNVGITMAELKAGDKVEVEYTVDDTGANVAGFVWVQEQGA